MKHLSIFLYSVITVLLFSACSKDEEVCPRGYYGSDCSQQVTPTKISISKIEVTRYPLVTNSGSSWDTGLSGPGNSLPDIYPTLYQNGNLIWDSSIYQEDVSGGAYSFIPNSPIQITSPTAQCTIWCRDFDDLDTDDDMGGITFTLYNSSNDFPSTLVVDANGTVAFKFYLSYTF
jgi:hypothetical protein